MHAKSMALLMLALGCGLVATIGVMKVLANRDTKPVWRSGETTSILVAATDVPLGDPLTAEAVKLEPWPKDKVPPGSISDIAAVEGRRTRQKLYAGEPVLENKLLDKGALAQGASAVIPNGYRVVSVKVDSVSGAGLILPGDRVDVLVYLISNRARGILETSTRTVLQDIKVFAVNDAFERDQDGNEKSISAKTISLLVTPEQAAKVTLANELGKIRLVMRSPDDKSHADDASAKPNELLGYSTHANRREEDGREKPKAENSNNNSKGLLDYLNQMKATLAAANQKANVPAAAAPTSVTWTIRVVRPDSVNDVVMESEESPTGTTHWRVNSGSPKPGAVGQTPVTLPQPGKGATSNTPATSGPIISPTNEEPEKPKTPVISEPQTNPQPEEKTPAEQSPEEGESA
ncbi:MAG: Flp pilus assembly protein CpaB [Thermoguttaceae bacterium]